VSRLLRPLPAALAALALATAAGAEPSRFEATLEAAEPGLYEGGVHVFDPANGNTGVDRTTFVVAPAP